MSSSAATPPPSETPSEAPSSAEEEVKAIAGEARRTYSLRDRLHGIKHTKRTVVLFTDLEAVDRWTELDRRLTGIEALLNPEVPDDATEEQRAELDTALADLRATYDDLEKVRAAAHAEMMAGALAIHMRSVPPAVFKIARHAADKAYALGDGTVPEEKHDEWDELRNRIVLGHVIERVSDAHGDLEFDRSEIARDLEETVPQPQWARVTKAYGEIAYTDQIGEAATTDPGF